MEGLKKDERDNTFAIVPRKVRDIGKGDEESVANPRNMSMLSNGCEPSITAELKSHLIKA